MEQTLATGPLLLCCYVQVWDEHPVLLGFTAPTKEFEYSNMLRKTGLSEPKNCTFQKRHRDHPLALGVLYIFFANHHSHGSYCPLLDSTAMFRHQTWSADSTTVTGVTGTFCRSHIASGCFGFVPMNLSIHPLPSMKHSA